MGKKIPIINKSRKKDVKVNVIKSEVKEELPTPPEDYKANNEEAFLDSDTLKEFESGFLDEDEVEKTPRLEIAKKLSKMSNSEIRQIVKAAKHLRKFRFLVKTEDELVEEMLEDF